MQDRFNYRIWKKQEKRMVYNVTYLNPLLLDERIAPKEAKNHILMQCTGLKDKNGKLIYEGDIIINPDDSERYAIIEWDDDECRYIINVQAERWCCDFSNYWSKELEVIDNIYENPELLKENKGE